MFFQISESMNYKWDICLLMRMNVFSWGWMSSHEDECLIMRMIVFSRGWMSFHEDERLSYEFPKDLGDFPRQTVGRLKTRKMGPSRRPFRDWKLSDWSETFCKSWSRWIGHTNFILTWSPSLCFGWVWGVQRKITRSGGVTTLNPDSLEGKRKSMKPKLIRYKPSERESGLSLLD